MNTWITLPTNSDGIVREMESDEAGLTTGRMRVTYPQNYRVNDSTFYTMGEAKAYADLYADATGIRPEVTRV